MGSDLLERLSSSCLSATVDLSSSSHISTLMRWEFLMTMGTSSNMCSNPMLAFFRLGEEEEEERGLRPGGVMDPQEKDDIPHWVLFTGEEMDMIKGCRQFNISIWTRWRLVKATAETGLCRAAAVRLKSL